MKSRKTLLLLFGGESSEHDISILSARNVAAALDSEKYDVKFGYISRDGKNWTLINSIDGRENGQEVTPILGKSAFSIDGNELKIDVVFPVLHGKNGEDGSVQGLLELLHVPFVGPSALNAAVTMDKQLTKQVAATASVPVVPWVEWNTAETAPTFDSLESELGGEVFVKPNEAGSSVGVTRVSSDSEFRAALDEAAKHSETVLIEKAIDAREIELAVLGSHVPRVSGAGEIISEAAFYDFDDKYSEASTSRTEVPAALDEDMLGQLQSYALAAYRAVRGSGMARVDFFIDRNDGMIYLNEINSIPGFTNISMYPKLWQHERLSYSDLLDELILDAFSRA